MSDKKLTVVIKGPLNPNSLNDIPAYLPYANVIISAWESGDGSSYMPAINKTHLNHAIELSNLDGVTLLLNSYQSLPEYFKSEISRVKNTDAGNRITMKLLFYSSAPAIRICKTPYVIVTRSDSSYPDLRSMLAKMESNKEKIVTINVNFRPDYSWKFHPADHVFGGHTSKMNLLMDECLAVCNMNENEFSAYMKSFLVGAPSFGGNSYRQWGGVDHPVQEFYKFVECCGEIGLPISNEQIIGLCYTKINETKVYYEKSHEYMQTYFDIVNISEMGQYAVSKNTTKDSLIHPTLPYVQSMEEFAAIYCEDDFKTMCLR